MFKRILLLTTFLCLMGVTSLFAQDNANPSPSIFLQPTNINTGDLVTSEPVDYIITINNFGKSLLYISKIKYT